MDRTRKVKYILHNKTFLPIVKKRDDMICILIIFQAQIAKSYHIYFWLLRIQLHLRNRFWWSIKIIGRWIYFRTRLTIKLHVITSVMIYPLELFCCYFQEVPKMLYCFYLNLTTQRIMWCVWDVAIYTIHVWPLMLNQYSIK